MVDSLKNSPRFVFGSKVINLLGTGFWDFDNKIHMGSITPYSVQTTLRVINSAGLWTLGD